MNERPRRPQGFIRRVAWLAGIEPTRTHRNVPVARAGTRSVCYFGRGRFFRLFDVGMKVRDTRSTITAALWLTEVKT